MQSLTGPLVTQEVLEAVRYVCVEFRILFGLKLEIWKSAYG